MQSISEKPSTLDENLHRHFLEVRKKMKPIVCQKLKLIYFDIPKCACTSLKHWIYKIEFDREFKKYKKDNRWIYTHNCGEFNTISLQKLLEKKQQDYKLITVIRDPIKRLISAYSNRVIHHKELSESVAYRDAIEAAGLKFNPDINYFIENLESYQNCAKTILNHTRPITHFIGQDLSLYTNVYPIEEINRIKEDVLVDSNPSLNTDNLPEIGKAQTGGPKLKLNVLKPESFDKLVAYYAKDYEILGNFYSLEKIKEQYISSIIDRGNELQEQGMLAESIKNYQNAIALQPERSASVYTELGNALEKNGQIEEAIATYQKAIEILPDNSHNSIVHAHLAKAMMAQKNIQGAIVSYQKALALQPEQPVWVYVGLGDALNQNGQVKEVIAVYQKAIEITPDHSNNSIVYAHLAKAMMAQKNTREAIATYQKAIALQPEQPVWVYVGLGDALNQKGQREEAIAVYQKAIEIVPDNCRVYPKLAKLMMGQGNIEGAVTAYQKAITQAISQKPKQPKWFYRWVYTELGEALEKNGQIEEAIAAYQEAIEITPDNSHNSIVHANLARAMMGPKNIQGAIVSYQKALALQPEQPIWVYIGLGDALNQNGQREEAIAAYEKAIEYNPSNKQILANDCLYQLIGTSGFKNALSQYFPSFDNIEVSDTNNKKKYLYCLNVNYPPEQILDLDNLLNRLPSEIKSLLAEGKCYLILDASNEGHAFEEKYGKAFHDLANILNCQRQQIIHLTQNELYLDLYNNWCNQNNLDIQNRIQIFTLNDALLALVQKNKEKYPVQNFNFINQRYREKKFLFLNNRPKVHRIFLLHQIIENNLLNNGLVSFNDNIKDGKEKYYKPKLKQLKCFLPHIGLDDLDRICQQIDSEYLPLRIDLVNRDNLSPYGRGPYMREIPLELYSQTYFSVISESEMDLGDKVKRFTEKSLKPFLGLHPFLIAGQPGALKLLRDIGFKTFSGYIDESYDLVEDPYERANLIVEQLKNLCSMSQEELHNWYTELSPILFYNYGHFINRMPIWCKRDLSKKLEMISIN